MKDVDLPPTLLHHTRPDAYPDIFEHGLRSAEALVTAFGLPADDADGMLGAPRPEPVVLGPHDVQGTAQLSHNRPLLKGSSTILERCLVAGESTLDAFSRLLNQRVYFWLDEADAEAHRLLMGEDGPYDRISLRTHAVLRLAAAQSRIVQMSRFNPGALPRSVGPRGEATWTTLDEAVKAKAKELVVVGQLDDVADAATAVTRIHPDGRRERVWAGGPWR